MTFQNSHAIRETDFSQFNLSSFLKIGKYKSEMNTKCSTKCATGCCCSAGRSPSEVSLFRFQGFRSSSVTPVNPKPQITRHDSKNESKIQAHSKWNSSTKFTMKTTVTVELPGTKMSWEKRQPFRAQLLPGSTYEPFRPVLSKDRTSVIDRRSKKVLQELAKKEMSAKQNNADDFKPEPFRAKLLPVSTYKPFRPVLSKDRQPVKRIAITNKPLILESRDNVNDATAEQHPAVIDRMPERKIRDKLDEEITFADEGGNELEPENQPGGVESDEFPIMAEDENLVFEEDDDHVQQPNVEESEIGENLEYSEEPVTTEESEIFDEQENEEELDGGEVPVTDDVHAPVIPQA